MLQVIGELASQLNSEGIRYCHWKSNWALADSVRGDADLDMLVHRDDAARFRVIAERLGFSSVVDSANAPFPAVEHYYALDADSGGIAHVHAYYKIVTGQSLVKNYRLPVEEMLLKNTRLDAAALQIPDKAAELILFTIRMLVKHTSPLELALLLRQFKKVQVEAEWLLEDLAPETAKDLLAESIPQLSPETFEAGVDALRRPSSLATRVALGFRVRRELRGYARHGAAFILLVEAQKFLDLLFHRLRGSKKGLTPLTGGAVIAFVGSEASGKSTMLEEIGSWLGKNYTLDRVHAGKPPGTLATMLPNMFVPLMRRVAPASRSTVLEADLERTDSPSSVSALFALRAVSLAYDRRALLRKAHAHAANGRIVLCDRYPSRAGQVDGPQLGAVLSESNAAPWIRWLARSEARLYAAIPRPDLVIYLTAPLETTLARNAGRDKTEPEAYVRRRHARSLDMRFEGVPVVRVNTDRSLLETVLAVKQAVWSAL